MRTDPRRALEEFYLKGKKIIYRKGSIILRPDEHPLGVFYLQTGYIKDTAISLDGNEFTLFIFMPEDIFPYSWTFNKIPNRYSYVAMTDCVIFRRDQSQFLDFINKNPEILFFLIQRILMRLRGIMQRLESLAFGNAQGKIASIMIILGERFGEKKDHEVKIMLPVSHKDLAELVGISRETVSIEIKKLEKKNIIRRNSRFYFIIDKRQLLKISRLSEASQ